MNGKTKLSPEERKERVEGLREFQQPIFDALGIPDARYIPKMAHHVKGLEGLHMGFFDNELDKAEDIYTEMVSWNLESEDPTRTLYKFRGNPHYKSEYATAENNDTRYLIPMDELEVVSIKKPIKNKKVSTRKSSSNFSDQNTISKLVGDTDMPMEKMTIRDYITIHTGKPVSTKSWINEIMTS